MTESKGMSTEQRAREFVDGAFGPFGVDQEPYVQVIKELIDGALEEKDAKIDQLRTALMMAEFGFNHARCPVCAGFDAAKGGEQDKVHTATCPIALAMEE